MVQIRERQRYRGSFGITVYDQGNLVRTWHKHNLIVDGAKGVMAHLVGGDFDGYFIDKIACGASDDAADVADTAITDAFSKAVNDISFPETDQVQFDWYLDNTEHNGNEINEFGLLTEGGTLFARIVLDEPINKTAQISVDVQWIIIFNNEEDGDGEPD
jgi:hypothetical protein